METLNYWFSPTRERRASLLFGVEPQAHGTGQVQSAYDYICWLAHAHGVTPTIVSNIVLEAVGKGHRQLSLRQHFGRDCHGVAAMAQHVLDGLSIVCGRNDLSSLTLRPLRDFIAGHSLLAQDRRCCLACFAATSNGTIPHGRLLWRLRDVEACPIHGNVLVTTECGAPRSSQLRPGQRVVLEGVCPKCGSIGRQCSSSTLVRATEEQMWKAWQIHDLLSRQAEVQAAGVANFKEAMKKHYGRIPGGLGRLAKRLNCSSASLALFVREPSARLTLNVLLQVAAVEGFNLTEFLLGSLTSHHPRRPAPANPVRGSFSLPDDWDSVAARARQAALEGLSARDFARQEGLNEGTFRRRLPDESRLLSTTSKAHNESKRQLSQRKVIAEVEEIAIAALERGLPLTLRSASKLTGRTWFPSEFPAQLLMAIRSALIGKPFKEKQRWSQFLRSGVQQVTERLANHTGRNRSPAPSEQQLSAATT
jgi:hypothetical protein